MRRRGYLHQLIWLICVTLGMAGQSRSEQPLSVIDWLDAQSARPMPAVQIKPDEPPVAKTALVPNVAVAPLVEGGPRHIGLVPAEVTGLPVDIWKGSALRSLRKLLDELAEPSLPAAQALLYTILLAEADAPGGIVADGEALALSRVEKLVDLGALDPAQSLIEQAGVTQSPAHFDLWMRISLLTGSEERACATLAVAPHLSGDYGTQVFCDVRAGKWQDAALIFGSAQALELLPPAKLSLLARFLEPEDIAAPSAPIPPREMDPLTFRLLEAIGEPAPTGNLPRAYAVADLRDLSGWKAQLEAAERLTRSGALPDNHLLGLYTDRRPAASGGVWDRAAGVQRFETALASGSSEAVSKTLPPIWHAMTTARLEVPFAALFAEQLTGFELQGRAQMILEDMQLLAPGYEASARRRGGDDLEVKIALGEPAKSRPADLQKAAILDAFIGTPARADLLDMARNDRLGEAILLCLGLLNDGTKGNNKALREALATFRALGLEDTARRAALQVLLLEPR